MTEPSVGRGERDRSGELRASLARVEERIARACEAAGRDRAEVTLIVVTKFWPASDVRLLAGLGVRDVAENRDQEAAAKAADCADLPLRWHFVGQLQTNKARSVLQYAQFVHSVDRPRLVRALSAAAEQRGGPEVAALVQVALEKEGESGGGGAGRGGVAPADVRRLAEEIMRAPGLRFAGLMTVAPLEGAYAGRPAAAFERVAELSRSLRLEAPAATMVSAGMSADLEEAIAAGATHVRVGSAVLGVRPPLR